MSAATITAICTGVVAVIGAVTALVKAVQAGRSADAAHARIDKIAGK